MPDNRQIAPTFFATAAALRAWLEEHRAQAPELMVGFYKKDSGLPSITWPEAVDEALCFGWIDGVRKSIDATSYMIRFTPRKARSIWSAVNIKRAEELAARAEEKSGIYSYEQGRAVALDSAFEQQFRADAAAWDFFQTRAPSYRKAAVWWVVSAKKDETKRKRLATLIEDSAQGRTVPSLTPPAKRR